jgi:hypothetical protein
MKLEFDGILLRNAEKADAAQLAAWWNDGAVMAHAGFPLGLGTTPEKIAADLASDQRRRPPPPVLAFKDLAIGK